MWEQSIKVQKGRDFWSLNQSFLKARASCQCDQEAVGERPSKSVLRAQNYTDKYRRKQPREMNRTPSQTAQHLVKQGPGVSLLTHLCCCWHLIFDLIRLLVCFAFPHHG